MSRYYKKLLQQYEEILTLLQNDEREVSEEIIQVIRDDIEDIMIKLGNASQIKPKFKKCKYGYDIEIN